METLSSILAWKMSRTEEPVRLQSIRSSRTGHDWVTVNPCMGVTVQWKLSPAVFRVLIMCFCLILCLFIFCWMFNAVFKMFKDNWYSRSGDTRPQSRRWEAGELAKVQFYWQVLPIASITAWVSPPVTSTMTLDCSLTGAWPLLWTTHMRELGCAFLKRTYGLII